MGQLLRDRREPSSGNELAEKAYVSDPMQRYMSEIRRHAVLGREEETVIARQYRDSGDARLELTLIQSNLRLVVKIALEYQSARLALLDLVQEGNVGLIHAVRKFDPDKNIRLASYAQWWIRAYILKYLMDNHKIVKVGTTQAQRKLFYNLKREKERLMRQGLVPSPTMLARALAVREQDVTEMEQRLLGRETSLDAPLQEGERGTMGEMIAADELGIDDSLSDLQYTRRVHGHLDAFAATLEGRDIDIWQTRMVSDSPQTLQEIGERFGVSRERARQLEARILRRLSRFMHDRVDPLEAQQQTLCG